MAEMFLERSFDTPLDARDVQAMASEGRHCFGLHRVEWRCSHLARGGDRMLCWFHAADAESVRRALRQSGADLTHLWRGTVHDTPDATADERATANILVERAFGEPVELAAIQALEDAGSWCLETHGVRFLRSYFSVDRKRMICLYHAPDAEAVRRAQHQARMPFERVWAFEAIRAGD